MPTFKDATDRLLGCVTAEQLAAELGVSRNTIARARMSPEAKGYRPPPHGWEDAVERLAKAHSTQLSALAKQLRRASRS